MGKVDLSNPQWGLGLTSYFGMAGVATQFTESRNVSRI